MATSVGSMEIRLTTQMAQFTKGMADAAKIIADTRDKGNKMGTAFAAVGRQVGATANLIKGALVGALMSLGTALVAAGVYKMAHGFGAAAETVDKLGKAAKRLGVGVGELSALRLAAGEAGVEFDTLAKLVGKAQNSIGDILNKGGSLMQVGETAVMLREVNGQARPIAQLLPEIAKALEQTGDEARQLDLAASIFGREGGDQFMTLLKDGGDFMQNLADQTDRARRLGVLFTDDQVKRLTAYNDAVGRIGEAFLGFRVMIMNEIAPALTELANNTAEAIGRFTKFAVNVVAVVREAVSGENKAKARDLLLTAASEMLDAVWVHISTRVQEFMVRLGAFLRITLNNIFLGLGDAIAQAAVKIAGVAAAVLKPVLEALAIALKTVGEYALQAGLAVAETWEEAGRATAEYSAEMAKERDRASRYFVGAVDMVEAYGESLRHVEDGSLGVMGSLKKVGQVATEMQTRMIEFGTQLRDRIESFASGASDAFAEFAVDGKASFADLAKSWGKMLISMAVQYWAFAPIFKAIGGWAGGMFGAPGSPNQGGPETGNTRVAAHGAAFESGVERFASGGLVTRPTLFRAAGGKMGVMGEAGTEAIMPLTKVGSDLGVRAIGGGTVINIIDQRQSGEPVQAKRSRGPDGREMIDLMIRDAVNRMVGEGGLDRAMAANYGIGRYPTAR